VAAGAAGVLSPGYDRAVFGVVGAPGPLHAAGGHQRPERPLRGTPEHPPVRAAPHRGGVQFGERLRVGEHNK